MTNVIIPEMRDIKRILGERKENSHKGNFGYVGLVGGSPEYSGAVKLASLSCVAMRAGAGVCRLIVPKSIAHAVMPYILESTLYLLPEKEGYIAYDERASEEAFKGLKAVAFGMGLGQKGDNHSYLKKLLGLPIKLIIDADGLNTLAKDLGLLENKVAQVILTPHIGEFSRLTGKSSEEILENPTALAKEFALRYGVTLILKNDKTIITDGSVVYLNERGTVGMATAGSGDVLSGILTALSGYLNSCLEIAVAGVYINGLAGEIAVKKENNNPFSMVASDTANSIKEAISLIVN